MLGGGGRAFGRDLGERAGVRERAFGPKSGGGDMKHCIVLQNNNWVLFPTGFSFQKSSSGLRRTLSSISVIRSTCILSTGSSSALSFAIIIRHITSPYKSSDLYEHTISSFDDMCEQLTEKLKERLPSAVRKEIIARLDCERQAAVDACSRKGLGGRAVYFLEQ